jgi:hypothetical protein
VSPLAIVQMRQEAVKYRDFCRRYLPRLRRRSSLGLTPRRLAIVWNEQKRMDIAVCQGAETSNLATVVDIYGEK